MERLAGRKRLMKRQQPGSGSPLAEEEEEEEDLLQRSPGQPASGELHRVSGKKRLMKRQQPRGPPAEREEEEEDAIFKDDMAVDAPTEASSSPQDLPGLQHEGTSGDAELDFGPLEGVLLQDDVRAFRDLLSNRQSSSSSSSRQLPLHAVLQKAIELGAQNCVDALLSLAEGGGRPSCTVDTSRGACHFLASMQRGKHRLRSAPGADAPLVVSPLVVALNASQHAICSNICSRYPLHALSMLRRHCPQLLLGQAREAEGDLLPSSDRSTQQQDDDEGEDDYDDMADDDADTSPPTLLFQLVSSEGMLLVPAILAALGGAARRGAISTHAVSALLRSKHRGDDSNALHWAAEEGLDVLVTALLDADPSLSSARDRYLCTPLHAACMMGQLRCVEELLRCSPEQAAAKDMQGWTPFLYCLFYERTAVAMILLRGGDAERSLEQFRELSRLTDLKGGDDRWKRCLETLATVPEFHALINRLVKENVFLLSGDLQFVKEYPFLLDVENKLIIGQHLLQVAEDRYHESFPIKSASALPAHRIALERSDPWRSLVQFCDGERDAEGVHSGANLAKGGWEARLVSVLRSNIQFTFRADGNEVGVGQGVEREVLELMSSRVCTHTSPLGLFRSSGDASHALEPINTTGVPLARAKSHYRYLGMLMGHCILRCLKHGRVTSNMLNINLKNTFWKLLLQKLPTLDDLADADAQIYQSLQYIKENDNAQDLDLYFSVSDEVYDMATGKTSISTSNLKRGGESIRVTDRNKEEYISLMVRHCTEIRMVLATEYTRKGLLAVVPLPVLALFSEGELGMMFSGNSKIDVGDWMRNATYINYSKSDQVIRWFWQFVLSLSSSDKALLLRFTTGSSKLPPGGFAQLSPTFTITRTPYRLERGLPTAATCFNLLKLPAYESEYALKKFVHTAILFGSEGFSFS